MVQNPLEIENIFIEGVKNIRLKEQEVELYTDAQHKENVQLVKEKVHAIVEKKRQNNS